MSKKKKKNSRKVQPPYENRKNQKKSPKNLERKKKNVEETKEKKKPSELTVLRSQVDIAVSALRNELGRMTTFIRKSALSKKELNNQIMTPFFKEIGYVSKTELNAILRTAKAEKAVKKGKENPYDEHKAEVDYYKELGLNLNAALKEIRKKTQKLGKMNQEIQKARKPKPNGHKINMARKKLAKAETQKHLSQTALDNISKDLTRVEEEYDIAYKAWYKAKEEILPGLFLKRDTLKQKFADFLLEEYSIIVTMKHHKSSGSRIRKTTTQKGKRTDLHGKLGLKSSGKTGEGYHRKTG